MNWKEIYSNAKTLGFTLQVSLVNGGVCTIAEICVDSLEGWAIIGSGLSEKWINLSYVVSFKIVPNTISSLE